MCREREVERKGGVVETTLPIGLQEVGQGEKKLLSSSSDQEQERVKHREQEGQKERDFVRPMLWPRKVVTPQGAAIAGVSTAGKLPSQLSPNRTSFPALKPSVTSARSASPSPVPRCATLIQQPRSSSPAPKPSVSQPRSASPAPKSVPAQPRYPSPSSRATSSNPRSASLAQRHVVTPSASSVSKPSIRSSSPSPRCVSSPSATVSASKSAAPPAKTVSTHAPRSVSPSVARRETTPSVPSVSRRPGPSEAVKKPLLMEPGAIGSGQWRNLPTIKECQEPPIPSENADCSPESPTMFSKKQNSMEFHAQRRLRVAGYGRKSAKPGRVACEGMMPTSPVLDEKKRCSWITPQSDSAFVAYHDEEWGVPVHDDTLLFELLVLEGAQAELSRPTLLSMRDYFRNAFGGFDPAVVAKFDSRKICALKWDEYIRQSEPKILGTVENAKQFLKIAQEFGSFQKYLWNFVNFKPIVNIPRNFTQIAVKSSKSEALSKDLMRRGFRYVGPTTVYSFMQAAGLVNDHLTSCFRHIECCKLSQLALP